MGIHPIRWGRKLLNGIEEGVRTALQGIRRGARAVANPGRGGPGAARETEAASFGDRLREALGGDERGTARAWRVGTARTGQRVRPFRNGAGYQAKVSPRPELFSPSRGSSPNFGATRARDANGKPGSPAPRPVGPSSAQPLDLDFLFPPGARLDTRG